MDVAHLELEEQYKKYCVECRCALRTVSARLENLRDEMEYLSEKRSPFVSIDSRVKSFESAIKKCTKKGWNTDIDTIKSEMRDVAGIRITVPYKDDIYVVAKAVKRQPSMTVIEERDYAANPKPSGYRSLHLIVEMDLYFMETQKKIPVEIQIRTEAMDLWASLEHRLRYKNTDPSPEAVEKFAELAKELAAADEQAMELRDFRKAEEGDDDV